MKNKIKKENEIIFNFLKSEPLINVIELWIETNTLNNEIVSTLDNMSFNFLEEIEKIQNSLFKHRSKN
jgi:hypothetical protein